MGFMGPIRTNPLAWLQDAFFLPGFLCSNEDVSMLERLRSELAEEGARVGSADVQLPLCSFPMPLGIRGNQHQAGGVDLHFVEFPLVCSVSRG